MISFRSLRFFYGSCRRGISFGILLLSIGFILQAGGLPDKTVTIRLAGDEWFLSSLVKAGAIPAFEQKTGIRIDVVFKNDRTILGELDHQTKAADARLDIIVVRHRLLGLLESKGQVRAIDGMLSDTALHDPGYVLSQQLFTNWWRGLSSYNGHTFGYPFTGLTTFLCYRKDLLEDPANRRDFHARYGRELRVPRTWQEFNELAEFFTRPDQKFYGTYIQGKKSLALWYEWLNLVYSFGGNILDAKAGWDYGDVVVNSPQNVAATTEYVKLIPFSPPDTLNFGWDEALSALQQGNVFMGLLWDDQVPFLEDSKVSKVAGKIGYTLIPSVGKPFSQMEGLTYAIPTESHHPQEAYRFLEFAMSAPAQIELTLKGGMSLRKSTYSDPRVRDLPYTSTFLASVPVAKEKNTIPESPKMTDAAVARLSEIVSGKTTPQTGLDQLALDLKSILGKKSRLRYSVKGH